MASSQTKDENAPETAAAGKSGDPFASDIFADPKTKAVTNFDDPALSEAEKTRQWIWRLPKTARSSADLTELLQNLPNDFSENLPSLLADALTKLLFTANENPVRFLFSDNFETDKLPKENINSWWFNIKIENSDAEFFVEIDKNFAVWLVDTALGGEISAIAQTRDLTPGEIAVLEFLAVNLTAEANKIINAPLFKFLTLGQTIPGGLLQKKTADSESKKSFHKIISSWQIVSGNRQSIVKIHFTPKALSALQPDKNNLLTAAPRQSAISKLLEKRIRDVRTRLFCGEAQLTLAEIAGLEKDDVVLLENYDFSFDNKGFYGSSKVLFGDGDEIRVNAVFESPETDSASEVEETADVDDNKYLVKRIKYQRVLRIFVESVEDLENRKFAKKFMAEKITGLTDGESTPPLDEAGGLSVENLAVNLRVELETRRLTLAEVGNLRVGQVIEMGARATDSVNLLINDRIIGRGELVEVEDQLGVRIIQILR